MSSRRITICLCSARSLIERDKVLDISGKLCQAGYTVFLEEDLCEKALSSVADMEKIASSVVVACYPRAVFSLFDSIGLTPVQVVDIRNVGQEDVLSHFNLSGHSDNKDVSVFLPDTDKTKTEGAKNDSDNEHLPDKAGFDAWYPVIDRERCNNCRKCHDFCLFGVYSNEDGKIVVKNPANCKNNCPACARVCPRKAIIFPKYEKSPINGGLADEEHAMSLDTKALYADALRKKLAERKKGISLLKRR